MGMVKVERHPNNAFQGRFFHRRYGVLIAHTAVLGPEGLIGCGMTPQGHHSVKFWALGERPESRGVSPPTNNTNPQLIPAQPLPKPFAVGDGVGISLPSAGKLFESSEK